MNVETKDLSSPYDKMSHASNSPATLSNQVAAEVQKKAKSLRNSRGSNWLQRSGYPTEADSPYTTHTEHILDTECII